MAVTDADGKPFFKLRYSPYGVPWLLRLSDYNGDGAVTGGDGDAFDEVYAAFHPRLFNFLARLSRRRDIADDLVEEAWLRVVAHAHRLRDDTRLAPWLRDGPAI